MMREKVDKKNSYPYRPEEVDCLVCVGVPGVNGCGSCASTGLMAIPWSEVINDGREQLA